MATWTMALLSERSGVSVLVGVTTALAAGNIAEAFALPTGFGDVVHMAGQVHVGVIATPVANPELRGPVQTIVGLGGASTTDLMHDIPTWRKVTANALYSQYSLKQGVLQKNSELVSVQFFGEDTGITMILQVEYRVVRLRNQGDALPRAVFSPNENISPTR